MDLSKSQNLFFIIPLMYVAGWCLVMKILSLMSGWDRLCKQFAFSGIFEGDVKRFQSMRIRWVRWNNALDLGVNSMGVFIAPFILLRIFHPPIVIPWSEFKVEETKSFGASVFKLHLRSYPDISLVVAKKTL